jgi:hypothetical protein
MIFRCPQPAMSLHPAAVSPALATPHAGLDTATAAAWR